MKLNKLNILKWILIVALTINITSCKDDEDSDQVELEVFGPSPILRGDDISFYGSNLHKVTSVILPNEIEITDITVESSSQISVTVPEEAEEGYITLVYPGGEIITKTLLDFNEPISIDTISAISIKAGETLTIDGEYLELIQKVIFADNVEVSSDDFTTWTREKLSLVVPIEAQTGEILFTDTASSFEIETDYELEVVLPSITAVSAFTDKKPGDELTITGADLDLVSKVILANSDTIDCTTTETTLNFTLTDDCTDGTIAMMAYSGVAIDIATVTMAVPTELVATPATGLRSGDVITITGNDMDLVTTVVFPGTSYEVTPASVSSDQITVAMTSDATSGDLVINTASGNTTSVAIETQKPELTSYSPSSIDAGAVLTIIGTDLDLVSSVTFTGNYTVEVTPSSSTGIAVEVPMLAESGELVLNMSNGESVTISPLTIVAPNYCYITDTSYGDVVSGEQTELEVYNGDLITQVLVNSVETQYIINGTSLSVLIPSDVLGTAELTLVSSSESITYEINVIDGGPVETFIYEGPLALSWGDGGRVYLESSYFESVEVGTIMTIYFTQNENWGQAQINNGGWSPITEFSELSGGYLTTDVVGDKSVTSIELELTEAVLTNILSNASGGNGIIMQGSDWTIDSVSITE